MLSLRKTNFGAVFPVFLLYLLLIIQDSSNTRRIVVIRELYVNVLSEVGKIDTMLILLT